MRASVSSPCAETAESFAGRLIAWQQTHGRRDLPWQGTRDPYRIWVSEVMLQQTQVGTVIPYFTRFVAAFPDLHVLAASPLSRVLEHWSGLGYYSRARNLHQAAQQLVREHDGRFPEAPEVVQKLPGVGRSTAAAICAFAFGARAPILDGNVRRVLARHRGVDGSPATAQVERRLWDEATRLLPAGRLARFIEAYTQGLMDLGSSVCVRARPACSRCPVRADCVAHGEGRTEEIPASRSKRALPHRKIALLIIEADGKVLLERRPPTGIWGGLWSLPEMAPPIGLLDRGHYRHQAGGIGATRAPGEAGAEGVAAGAKDLVTGTEDLAAGAEDVAATFAQLNQACVQRVGRSVRRAVAMPAIDHTFTHFRLTMLPFRLLVAGTPEVRDATAVAVAAEPGSAGHLWIAPAAAGTAALPAPIKKLLRSLALRYPQFTQ